ncbi:hypothetical protein GLOIN_2v1778295 [Rhizophagus irregularis DAOM 181602=DAOM 197198]|nr:hypothetical protein GLOIN_2v1778295 [Rhizophagus irregularis DAOM 181602=DAOM 197198]
MSSLPASPASITEEISSRTMSDVVKDFNTEELIDYLERKDLKLDEDDIKILRKEKISEFIESLSQKLRNYSSLKTLDDLKKMLRRNKVNGEDITSIKQFTPGAQSLYGGYYLKTFESLVILRLDMRRIWRNLKVHSKQIRKNEPRIKRLGMTISWYCDHS